jgi:hypothetical protein
LLNKGTFGPRCTGRRRALGAPHRAALLGARGVDAAALPSGWSRCGEGGFQGSIATHPGKETRSRGISRGSLTLSKFVKQTLTSPPPPWARFTKSRETLHLGAPSTSGHPAHHLQSLTTSPEAPWTSLRRWTRENGGGSPYLARRPGLGGPRCRWRVAPGGQGCARQ